MQCCLDPLGQHCTRILPVQCYPKSVKTTLNRNFSCAMLSGASWTSFYKDFTYAMLSEEYSDNIEQFLFLCNVVWSLLDNIAQGFYLCNIFPRVLRQHWTGILPVQCCLEPLGQHCARLFVQCCPKGIKTTLNRKFSCAMLSRASWTTLHKDFICAMLSQASWTTMGKDYTCEMLSQEY